VAQESLNVSPATHSESKPYALSGQPAVASGSPASAASAMPPTLYRHRPLPTLSFVYQLLPPKGTYALTLATAMSLAAAAWPCTTCARVSGPRMRLNTRINKSLSPWYLAQEPSSWFLDC